MRGFMSGVGAALAVAAMSIGAAPVINDTKAVLAEPKQVRKVTRKRYRGGGARYSNNGSQECARRVRQIAAGQLTVSNGLTA